MYLIYDLPNNISQRISADHNTQQIYGEHLTIVYVNYNTPQ